MLNQIITGDCLFEMKKILDKSVDLILCDLPYGSTRCKWDVIIPFKELWNEYKRVLKDKGTIVLTSIQPFTSLLINSNLDWFKYTLVWEKSKATGYLNAKKIPMRAHEDVCVFYKKHGTYNPQMVEGSPYFKGTALRPTDVYGSQKTTTVKNETGLRYPRSVIYFKTAESEGPVNHPTQKPIALFEWLIKTYSNENDLVLDNCIGSGTTAIACLRTNRKYIGIEKEQKYIDITNERISKETNNLSTTSI